MEKMLAAVFKGNGVMALEERNVPVIKEPDQVILKVIACGICGSDLHALHVPDRTLRRELLWGMRW